MIADITQDGIIGTKTIAANIPMFPMILLTSIESRTTIENRENTILFSTAMNAATPEIIAIFLIS